MKSKTLLISLFLVVLLCSCSDTTDVQNSTEKPVEETGYPVVEYTVPTDKGYPIETPIPDYTQGPDFHINLPVSGGDMTVTGTGPAGVPIVLVDISEFALVLQETTIDEDGTFSFSLENPLVSGHSIGLQLGDIEETEFNESDFLYNQSYYERPMIGVLFDIAVVE